MVHTPLAERFIAQESLSQELFFDSKRNLVQTCLSKKIFKEILAIYVAFMLKVILSDKHARTLCVRSRQAWIVIEQLFGFCSWSYQLHIIKMTDRRVIKKKVALGMIVLLLASRKYAVTDQRGSRASASDFKKVFPLHKISFSNNFESAHTFLHKFYCAKKYEHKRARIGKYFIAFSCK